MKINRQLLKFNEKQLKYMKICKRSIKLNRARKQCEQASKQTNKQASKASKANKQASKQTNKQARQIIKYASKQTSKESNQPVYKQH